VRSTASICHDHAPSRRADRIRRFESSYSVDQGPAGRLLRSVGPLNTVRLRAYHGDDWTSVCEIYDLSKPEELLGVVDSGSVLPLEADTDMQALFRGSRILVAEESDRIVGFGGSRGSFITWLFVHPTFRRRGVATALVRDMLARLQQPVTLNVMVSNVPARALYARLGFVVEREFRGSFQGRPCNVAKLSYATAD
jgi:ribosomal protein S18 acetylase RimI-like enzyme